ncbi:tripartite ATP-independent periplasmic transporter DctQ component [Dinoroseobacter shibae DFL 12 = DSM 16493]|jgi:TRAP-type C4-dicarboxylate transport system permease small subunit|uniref:TRAP transporter small permease protein n=1 Tax=Dinoroseobacter shibae (strain DSM 16493 / NCIMB 14021 / DFL 12) TaxID=398580 RepID=A8LRZ5_DINSH|nr:MULTISPECIES: TRAP transporter small permease [Dinoroseobacter]ABV92702.1 tripartite ATP-independent periplasmic transporter DctQ component [Dinoroseobacter shibae DFL 12 = DSM 16493]MDD9715772.1 TRAP transporter small permease [Dinoroseobacter sp. PD6]URF47634.1 TRAP transporter small permease [Dinoroseobacter shibae]URF51944.1 TRAP transporter small permease [Dinoroseobacter shibae]
MDRLDTVIDTADRWLGAVLDVMVITLAGLLLLLLNWAVFARFILNDSVSWGEELPAHLLAMLTFIGAAYLTRTNEHLGFDAVLRVMPPGMQRWVTALNLVLMGAFGAMLAWYGGIAAASFGARSLISVDLPMMLFRGAMPLGGALIALFCAVRLAGIVTGRIDPLDLLPESDA